jgi:hypothetical protein
MGTEIVGIGGRSCCKSTLLIVDDCSNIEVGRLLKILGDTYEVVVINGLHNIEIKPFVSPICLTNPLIKQHGAYRQFEKRDKRKNYRSKQ